METIKDKTYYSVIGFEDLTKTATFHKDGYSKKGNAQRVAQELIKHGYQQVILRLENVFLRNENNEISTSCAIERYTQNGIETLKK